MDDAMLKPVKDDGLMDLESFVEKAKEVLDDMHETFEESTGESADEPRDLDYWLEQLSNAMHNA